MVTRQGDLPALGAHGDSESTGAVLAALAANLAIAAAKFAGALYTGSGALLAEALHSLADTGNQGLLLWGMYQSKTPASPDFSLGHGRAVYFWSFVVALMLFSMGGVFSIYEGIHKLGRHDPIRAPWVALAILAFSLLTEAYSFFFALGRINRLRRGKSLWRWFVDTRRSELMVVIGEDSAALVGLTFALLAVILAMATGNPMFDALGSILVGVLLVIVAATLGYEIKGLLIGQSAGPLTRQAIWDFMAASDELVRIEELITLQLGEEIFVVARVELRHPLSLHEATEAIGRCKREVSKAFPAIAWIFIEPGGRPEP